MSTAAKEIIEAALKLEPVERERIADTLWQSLEDPAAVETAWSEEIQRRILAADTTRSIPHRGRKFATSSSLS